MKNITLETLKTQLAQFEAQCKEAESNLYRLDGAIQVVKHLIAEESKAVEEAKPAKKKAEKQDS